jgi:hypothetical protein
MRLQLLIEGLVNVEGVSVAAARPPLRCATIIAVLSGLLFDRIVGFWELSTLSTLSALSEHQ